MFLSEKNSKMARSFALLALSISFFLPTQTFAGNLGGSYNGLANTPQMGWDNWNAFGCNINETLFLNAAQKIVDYGYVIHACLSPQSFHPPSNLSHTSNQRTNFTNQPFPPTASATWATTT